MEQPTIEQENELLSVDLNKKENINIEGTNTVLKIGWMKPYTMEKISELILRSDLNREKEIDDESFHDTNYSKFQAKLVSLGVINGVWIIFFHWIYWRYLYYLKGYTYNQLEPITRLIKKKIPALGLYKTIIYAMTMRVTTMTVTEEEAK